MRAVNLRASESKPTVEWSVRAGLAAIGLALLVVVSLSVVAYVKVEGRAASNRDQATGLRRQLALADLARQKSAALEGKPSMSGLRSAVLTTLGGRERWGGLLRGLGRVMPPGVWLTKLSVSHSGAGVEAAAASSSQPATPIPAAPLTGPAPGEATLSLVGCAVDQALVGRAVNGVNRLPGTSEASVSSKQAARERSSSCRGYPSFQLSFALAGGTS